MLLAAGAGVLVAVLAALLPAVHAGLEEPAIAVRRIPPRETWGHRLLQLAGSACLLGAGVGIVLYRLQLANPRWGTYGGFACVLLGTLLATPLLAAVVARVLQPAARWCLGMEGRLAADNLVRAPGRTGLVITVVAAGVAIFIQTAGVIRSNKEPILGWVDRTIDADLFITSGSAQVGSGQNLLLQAELCGYIQRTLHEDVRAVVPIRARQVSFRNNLVYLMAIDADGFADKAGGVGPLAGTDLYPRLREPGQANTVISKNFAGLYKVGVGDTIALRGSQGAFFLRVAGVIEDYNFNRGGIFIDHGLYEQQYGDTLVDVLYVYLRPDADANAVQANIERRGKASTDRLTQG